MSSGGDETFNNEHLGKIQHALQVMRQGEPMMKYGRRGKPHMRFFRVNHDGTKIFWVQKSSEPLKGGVLLAEVSRVQKGRDTHVFGRFREKSSPELRMRSLSLIYGQRTLDIECSSMEQCHLWLLGLKYCVHQAHKQEGLHASLRVPAGGGGSSRAHRSKAGGSQASSVRSMHSTRSRSQESVRSRRDSAASSHMSDSEMSVTMAPSDAKIICEGWLEKRNDDTIGVFKDRYFVLRTDDTLTYYSSDINTTSHAHAKGVISLNSQAPRIVPTCLGKNVTKCDLADCCVPDTASQVSKIEAVSKRRQKHGVNIHTPHRVFVLNARSKASQEKWVDVLQRARTEIHLQEEELAAKLAKEGKSAAGAAGSSESPPRPKRASAPHYTSPPLPAQTFDPSKSPQSPHKAAARHHTHPVKRNSPEHSHRRKRATSVEFSAGAGAVAAAAAAATSGHDKATAAGELQSRRSSKEKEKRAERSVNPEGDDAGAKTRCRASAAMDASGASMNKDNGTAGGAATQPSDKDMDVVVTTPRGHERHEKRGSKQEEAEYDTASDRTDAAKAGSAAASPAAPTSPRRASRGEDKGKEGRHSSSAKPPPSSASKPDPKADKRRAELDKYRKLAATTSSRPGKGSTEMVQLSDEFPIEEPSVEPETDTRALRKAPSPKSDHAGDDELETVGGGNGKRASKSKKPKRDASSQRTDAKKKNLCGCDPCCSVM